jgi:hypothetical protein
MSRYYRTGFPDIRRQCDIDKLTLATWRTSVKRRTEHQVVVFERYDPELHYAWLMLDKDAVPEPLRRQAA